MASKNIKFLELWFQNFKSYGKKRSSINFDAYGMSLIKGVNLDDTVNGIGANGTGKSTIIEALVYAIYGEAMGDAKVDDLINDVNKNKSVVGVKFSIGNDLYVIERFRKMKAGPEGTYTTIFKNEDIEKDPSDPTRHNLAKATLPETNKFTSDLIGMPKELFIRLVVFDADEQSFFKMGAQKQRDVMEFLFQLTVLTEKAEAIKEDHKHTKNEIDIVESSIRILEQQQEEYEERLAAAQRRIDRWVIDIESSKTSLVNQLNALNMTDIELERSMFTHNDQVTADIRDLKTNSHKHELLLSEQQQILSSLKSELKLLRSQKSTLQDKMLSANKDVKRWLKEIDTLKDNKCPECLQPLPDAVEKLIARTESVSDAETKLSELIESVDVIDSTITSVTEKIDTQQSVIDTIQSDIDAVMHQIQLLRRTIKQPSVASLDDINQLDTRKQLIQQQIGDLEGKVNPHVEAYEELANNPPTEPNYDDINRLKKLFDHQKFMVKLLTDKKSILRQRLINKRLPYLNERLTHYLTQLGLPYQVEFMGDLTAKIKRRGRDKAFSNLSHGQRARVNFALTFAFRDVLERVNSKVNVCLLDEVLDKALCDVGANAAITMIAEKCKRDKLSVFVITHKKEIANRFHNIITVSMKDGFSSIEQ